MEALSPESLKPALSLIICRLSDLEQVKVYLPPVLFYLQREAVLSFVVRPVTLFSQLPLYGNHRPEQWALLIPPVPF